MAKVTKLQKEEKNDCVVRAISAAFDMTYNQAHAYAKDNLGRKDKKGTPSTWFDKIQEDKSLYKMELMGETLPNSKHGLFTHYENVTTGTEIVCAMTTGTFMDTYKEGTYIVLVRNHTFVIKDGEVLGNAEDATKLRVIVKGAIKIVAPSKTPKK